MVFKMRSESTICCQDPVYRLDVSDFSRRDSVYWEMFLNNVLIFEKTLQYSQF